MAEIIKSTVGLSSMSCEIAAAAATGTDYFLADNADQRLTLLVKNTNATQNATVAIAAGNGNLSGRGPVTVTVGAGKTAALPMSRAESARVKVLGGADSGKVFVNTTVDAGGTLSGVSLSVLSVL